MQQRDAVHANSRPLPPDGSQLNGSAGPGTSGVVRVPLRAAADACPVSMPTVESNVSLEQAFPLAHDRECLMCHCPPSSMHAH
jgi:hypothetical protein